MLDYTRVEPAARRVLCSSCQVHHTHYHVNFGQFFTFCDRFWGTLKRPEDMRSYRKPSTKSQSVATPPSVMTSPGMMTRSAAEKKAS